MRCFHKNCVLLHLESLHKGAALMQGFKKMKINGSQ